MANRYWVGGSAAWNSTAGTKWATTSGGAGGAAVPTISDDVFFDANSGAVTVTSTGGTSNAKSIDCTGFTGTLDFSAATAHLDVAGSVILNSTMTFTKPTNASYGIYFNTGGVNYTAYLTSGGHDLGYIKTRTQCNELHLNDALTCSTLYLEGTSFYSTNYAIAVGSLYFSGLSDTLSLGSSIVTVTGTGDAFDFALGTLSAGTSKIILANSSNLKTVFGATFYNLELDGTTHIIKGSNTFNQIESTNASDQTIQFEAGKTTTILSDFIAVGTSGHLCTVTSTTTGVFYLVKSGGGRIDGCDYLDVSHSVATPTLTWYAGSNSTDSQATAVAGSGWYFGANSFADPTNIYSSDNTYATLAAISGVLTVEVSKDAGANWQTAKTVTFTSSESTETCGTGSTELWGASWTRADMVDANFRVRLSHNGISQIFKTFGFTTGTDPLTGIEIAIEGKYASSTLSLDHLKVKIYYGTSPLTVQAGSMAYASDGRKNGEGAGSGTGVLVFYDGTAWRAVDTGASVAA